MVPAETANYLHFELIRMDCGDGSLSKSAVDSATVTEAYGATHVATYNGYVFVGGTIKTSVNPDVIKPALMQVSTDASMTVVT